MIFVVRLRCCVLSDCRCHYCWYWWCEVAFEFEGMSVFIFGIFEEVFKIYVTSVL